MRLWQNGTRGLTAAALALAGLMGIGMAASPTHAQIGEMAGFTEVMQPEYYSRDLVIFDQGLELDDAQQDILETLFRDYEADFNAGRQAMQDRLKDMKNDLSTGDKRRILSIIFVPFEDWGKDRRKLGDDFLSNVKGILNGPQQELWPPFERRLVREKTLSKGVLAGESLNLLHIIRDLKLTASQEFDMQAVVEAYEIELDDALRARNDVLRVTQGMMVHALQEDQAHESLKLIEDQLKKRVRVRDVNDRYILLLAEALPDDRAGEFRSKALTRAYPKAYRQTPGQRMYKAAVNLEDLEDYQIQAVQDLRNSFDLDIAIAGEDIAEKIREHEPAKLRNRVEMYTTRLSGGQPRKLHDPSLEASGKRDRIDDQYIELLRTMMTDEQFTGLPGADRWVKRRTAQTRRARQIEEAKKKESSRQQEYRKNRDQRKSSRKSNPDSREDKAREDRDNLGGEKDPPS